MATIEKNNAGIVESSNMNLTIRLIMQGKEVGSIIGKKGEIVKRFRDESGAKINISDGSCPERIVTVAGHTEAIYKAFALICNKFEEDLANLVSPNTVPRPPITFRLIVPASQCGSLIGKGGSKIKEIREISGASVQVASEMLPNSTERAVTISGGADSITQCVYHICNVMSESPPKGITVPYRPIKPVTVAAGLGAASAALQVGQATFLPTTAGQNTGALNPAALVPVTQAGKLGSIPLSGLSTLNGLAGFTNGAINPAALAALASQQQQQQQNRAPTAAAAAAQQQTHEMTVPNELIGCIIGKGGSKIAEIRQLSGAMIRISNCEERESGSNMDRTITITGNAESVALAQYLINMRISMETASMGGMAGFQYIAPNHIIKTQIH
ncbi:poly(rC)-binding protein 2 isoform X2 [Lepeophtheirus salmonis]|uniref:poly(rC)-binding protein 2 isoform X2 n=1 Tax=Lepeophtheirus salmonis TaxID=72036 RepID=UPI003AF4085E